MNYFQKERQFGLQPTRASSLTRSKSLRLPTNKPMEEMPPTGSLTRQGSVRIPKSKPFNGMPPPSMPSANQLSLAKKPHIKPKPQNASLRLHPQNDMTPSLNGSKSIMRSSSTSNVNSAWSQPKAAPAKFRTLQRNGSSGLKDNLHMTSSLYLNGSSPSRSIPHSGGPTDLSEHLRRLTEEHEKLQMEYARFRIQVLENNSHCFSTASSSSIGKDSGVSETHSSSGDSEDSADTNFKMEALRTKVLQLEALNQGYYSEIFKAQEDARKLQKKYWETILQQNAFEGSQPSAPQQVIDLVDKLEEKHKELQTANHKLKENEEELNIIKTEHLHSTSELEKNNEQLANLSQDNVTLKQGLQNAKGELRELREMVDFLQSERDALSEGLQETENKLMISEAELTNQKSILSKMMENSNQLYLKIQNKNQKVQSLQLALDQSQGQAKDVLVSQGAERTMAVLALSQITDRIQAILTALLQFASSEMNFNNEMLEGVIKEDPLNQSGEEEALNKVLFADSPVKSAFTPQEDSDEGQNGDDYCQNLTLIQKASSKSLVQTIVEALEKRPVTPQKQDFPYFEAQVSQSAFKPVGVTTPFKPMPKIMALSESHNTEAVRRDFSQSKSSFETQVTTLNGLLNKVSKVMTLIQSKYLENQALKKEKEKLQACLEDLSFRFQALTVEVSSKDAKIEVYVAKSKEKSQAKEYLKKQNESLQEDLDHLRAMLSSLQAVNEEQNRQLREEVQRLVCEAANNYGCPKVDDAGIYEKLSLKQQVASLQETVNAKDSQLEHVKSKFFRNRKTLEDNWNKAEKEVARLDHDLALTFETLKQIPQLVARSPALKSLFFKFGGDPSDLASYSTPLNSPSKSFKVVTTV